MRHFRRIASEMPLQRLCMVEKTTGGLGVEYSLGDCGRIRVSVDVGGMLVGL